MTGAESRPQPAHELPEARQLDFGIVAPAVQDQLRRFEWPAWFTRGKTTPRTHISNVARGLHPFGAKLGPEGTTCSGCRQAITTWKPYYGSDVTRDLKYKKCALARQTHGLGTDLRLRWRGCMYWKSKKTR